MLLTLLLSCGPTSGPSQTSPQKIHELLKGIPKEHRQRLKTFFENLILDTSAAYTLYGGKPWSVQSYTESAIAMYPGILYHPEDSLALCEGWESWQHYGYLFRSDSFLLRRVALSGIPSYWYIIMMNRSAVLEVIRRHHHLFQEVLGNRHSPEEMWSQIERSDEILNKIVEHSELLGTILGYGRANAHAFHRRYQICMYLNQCMKPPGAPLAEMEGLSSKSRFFLGPYREFVKEGTQRLVPVLPDPGFDTLSEELNAICEGLSPNHFPGPESMIERFLPPQFMALKDDPETADWCQSYAETRRELPHLLQDKSIFEAVLVQWMSGTAKAR